MASCEVCHVGRKVQPPPDGLNRVCSTRAKHWLLATHEPRSDRIRDVHEDVLDAEPPRQPVAERADAERLGRVVAGGDEVDADSRASAITCSRGSPVKNASSPQLDRLVSASAAEPETIPIRRTRSGPAVEHERLAARHLAHAREELLRRRRRRRRTCRPARSRGRGNRRTPRGARSRAHWPGSRCCPPRGARRAGCGRPASARSCLNSGRSRPARTGVRPVGWKSQNSPWWTSSSCASSSTARSISSRWAETPVTTRRPPRRPGTCRPFGPRSAKRAGSSSSSSAATIEVIRVAESCECVMFGTAWNRSSER